MVKKGETLLIEKPFAFVLKSSLKAERCNHCFSVAQLQKCSECHYVYYCDRNCQKLSWPTHKLECKGLSSLNRRRILADSALLLIRIYLRLKSNGNEERTEYNKERSRSFAELMTHMSEVQQDNRRMEHFSTLLMLVKIFFNDQQFQDEGQILEIYCKMCINSFNILDNDLNSIGTGVYLAASILDHSCEPNAVALFEGTTIHIRSIKNIPKFEWNKVRISYIDVLNTTAHRKQELQSMYYFLCGCTRCLDVEEDHLMDAMACSREKCSGYVYVAENSNSKCNRCGSITGQKRMELFKEVTQLADYHLQNMKSKDMAYIDVCELTLKKQKSLFHEFNIRRVKTLDLAFEASINLERWDDAVTYGLELLPGFKKYYREYNPHVGLLSMKLLKLLLLRNDFVAAKRFYDEAKEILLTTHGSTHSLFVSLQEIFSCPDK